MRKSFPLLGPSEAAEEKTKVDGLVAKKTFTQQCHEENIFSPEEKANVDNLVSFF